MIENKSVYLAIAGAACVTYLLRFGGLLLADQLPKKGRFRRFMNALPGTILLSLIVPAAISAGPWGWLATGCTAVCSRLTGNVFAAMIVGVAVIAFGRWLG